MVRDAEDLGAFVRSDKVGVGIEAGVVALRGRSGGGRI